MTERRVISNPCRQGDPFVLIGGDVSWKNGISFRTEEMAERARVSTLAEAFTLHHAQYRLCVDPLEPVDSTVSWKIVENLPLTEREDAWLEPQRVVWRAVLLGHRARACGIGRSPNEEEADFVKRLCKAEFVNDEEERARWEAAWEKRRAE